MPGPIVLFYFPNRKIIKRLYSVAVLKPVRSHMLNINKKTPIMIPIIIKISEIFITP